ncbi:MAG: hypothetical protein LBL94_12020 [Prevotellaceae bacterium]|jgi:hypothetical protein|nr:hypothetical protein [Prevotellaceae bacterium]
MTKEQADYLLKLPKKIINKEGNLLPQITIHQKYPFYERFGLLSEKDDEFACFYDYE